MTTTNHGAQGYGHQPPQPSGYAQPYPPQFAGQMPAPAPKKRRKWPWVVGALVAVMVVGGMMSGGEDDASTANSNTPAAVSEAEAAAAGIGTPVRDGKFEFVVTGIESGLASVGDNPYLTETAQGAYTVVNLTVTNTSDKPQTFFQSNQELFDDQGRKFTNDGMAEAAILLGDGPSSAIITEINPGNQVSTVVVFDLPAGAAADHIELHDSTFSNGATVNLR